MYIVDKTNYMKNFINDMYKILDYVMIFIVIAIFGVLIMYFIYNIWRYLIKPFI